MQGRWAGPVGPSLLADACAASSPHSLTAPPPPAPRHRRQYAAATSLSYQFAIRQPTIAHAITGVCLWAAIKFLANPGESARAAAAATAPAAAAAATVHEQRYAMGGWWLGAHHAVALGAAALARRSSTAVRRCLHVCCHPSEPLCIPRSNKYTSLLIALPPHNVLCVCFLCRGGPQLALHGDCTW